MVEQYLQSYYSSSKWPYFPLNKLCYLLSDKISREEVIDGLNKLYKEGRISTCNGVNGKMVKIIEKV